MVVLPVLYHESASQRCCLVSLSFLVASCLCRLRNVRQNKFTGLLGPLSGLVNLAYVYDHTVSTTTPRAPCFFLFQILLSFSPSSLLGIICVTPT